MMSRFWIARLHAADAGVLPVAQIVFVDDLVLRERQLLGLRRGAEQAHDGPARPHHADHLTCQRLRGLLVEEVEDVPAQDAVDAGIGVAEACSKVAGS